MTSIPAGHRYRRSARVLLVDPDDRLLTIFGEGLIRTDRPYCFTVGGGVEDGESLAEAAAREVREETGLRVDPADLGAVVLHTEGAWTTATGIAYYSDDYFFLLRTDRFTVGLDGLQDEERREITHVGWRSMAELEADHDTVYPLGLAGVLKRVLDGEAADGPIELPWYDR